MFAVQGAIKCVLRWQDKTNMSGQDTAHWQLQARGGSVFETVEKRAALAKKAPWLLILHVLSDRTASCHDLLHNF